MEKKRCFWAENVPEIYVRYHDEEWGREVHDDHKLFEMLLLESFQAGLSWLTILKKREAFREAFDAFDVAKVAGYTEEKQKELMQNPGIIRNRLKIRAAVKNAVIFQQIQREYGSFSAYLWGFTKGKVIYRTQKELPTHTALSDEISADLYKRGMRFVGSVIIYSYLQAVGIVNDHEPDCFLHSSSKACG
ncbi:DNA-3-methyladenine glycosylase I [[Clostridium] innocuum]|uniref:DNA-3-methyladenine glycosylase I n=1 Tax=Clostridium innocuum TaxID=1522 RepID=UPI0032594B54